MRILQITLIAGIIACGGLILLEMAVDDAIAWIIEINALDSANLETTP